MITAEQLARLRAVAAGNLVRYAARHAAELALLLEDYDRLELAAVRRAEHHPCGACEGEYCGSCGKPWHQCPGYYPAPD